MLLTMNLFFLFISLLTLSVNPATNAFGIFVRFFKKQENPVVKDLPSIDSMNYRVELDSEYTVNMTSVVDCEQDLFFGDGNINFYKKIMTCMKVNFL